MGTVYRIFCFFYISMYLLHVLHYGFGYVGDQADCQAVQQDFCYVVSADVRVGVVIDVFGFVRRRLFWVWSLLGELLLIVEGGVAGCVFTKIHPIYLCIYYNSDYQLNQQLAIITNQVQYIIQLLKNQLTHIQFFYYPILTAHIKMAQKFYNNLINKQNHVGDRYFAVFQLKNIGTDQAIKYMMDAYPYCGDSVLLKHELLYALGQLPEDKYAIVREFLIQKMEDQKQNNLSRHQSAEALANYFDQHILKLYQKHLNSQCKQLKYTCEIALQKLKNKSLKQNYGQLYSRTMQPAAPFTQQQFTSLLQQHNLQQTFQQKSYIGVLQHQNLSLFQKYRIMYYMRNKNTKQCIENLCKMLSLQHYKQQCSLLKHEICFIIGQIGYDCFQDMIRECVENQDQEDIVRHQALAAVASQSKDPVYLKKFVDGKYPQLIRQSAQVAIHSIQYWTQ